MEYSKKKEEYCVRIMELVQTEDLRTVTMDQIAEGLGVTKRTLYNYFADKASMVRDIMNHHIDVGLAHLAGITHRTDVNAVEAATMVIGFNTSIHERQSPQFLRSIFEYYSDVFKECNVRSRNLVHNFFISNVEQGRREGLYLTDFDPYIIANLLFDSLDSMRNEVMLPDTTRDLRKTFIEVLRCILRGIVSPEGSIVLEKEFKKLIKIY